MKKVALIITFLTILLLVSLSNASSFFEILNVSPIKTAPNSETNFTITVKGLGSKGGYVDLVFKNLTTNLSVVQNGGTKYIFSGATNSFNGTIKAGDIASGNYTFAIGLSAKGSPYNWKKAYIIIEPQEANKSVISERGKEGIIKTLFPTNNTTPSRTAESTPDIGILAAIAAVLITARRIKG